MSRSIVLAPHPDDEVLGAAHVLAGGALVVQVTDGAAPWLDGDEIEQVKRTRRSECLAAWDVLGAEIDGIEALGFDDLGAWRQVDDLAVAIGDVLTDHPGATVYVPAHQGGHPDHDATFVAALLARRRAGDRHAWRVYGLYGFDERSRLVFGRLDAGRYPGAEQVVFDSRAIERKSAAIRCFGSQVRPGSVVQRWLDAPYDESTAPMPATLPSLGHAVYYDEEVDFVRQGVTSDRVSAELEKALRSSQ